MSFLGNVSLRLQSAGSSTAASSGQDFLSEDGPIGMELDGTGDGFTGFGVGFDNGSTLTDADLTADEFFDATQGDPTALGDVQLPSLPNTTGSYCPVNCYETCKQRDIRMRELCRIKNEIHVKAMKAMGCKGTACSTPSFAKSCSKKRRVKSCTSCY